MCSSVLLLTPPFIQLNAPYPATPYLTGFLRSKGIPVAQADLSLECALRLLSKEWLETAAKKLKIPVPVQAEQIDASVAFLQGRDPSLAWRISRGDFFPRGARLKAAEQADFGEDGFGWAFGSMGHQDRARFFASLFLDDAADWITKYIDKRFGFARYAERLAASAPSFDPLLDALEGRPTLVDGLIDTVAEEFLLEHRPAVIGLTVPFPGCVYGAFRIARVARRVLPKATIVLGGGYANTELRSLSDPRVFDYVDYVTLDDGEDVLEALLCKKKELVRTFRRNNGRVEFLPGKASCAVALEETGTPVYEGLPLGSYPALFEMLNPVNRLWSDGRWNKLTLAKGCYWHRCAFCDVSLDYIRRYDPCDADVLVDRIVAIQKETGQSGFHFVDEAAPPALLGRIADRLIKRKINITWWGNVRFDRAFKPELCRRLAKSGCVALTGGLEAPSDRLLKLISKGTTIAEASKAMHAIAEAGILVHAYLMYGLPTQTKQETIEGLEVVRRLFAEGCLHSAYWHRFSVTVHSPIGKEPEKFGLTLRPPRFEGFASNDVPFDDPTPCPHERLSEGLRKAVYNYMHGAGLDEPVEKWFI